MLGWCSVRGWGSLHASNRSCVMQAAAAANGQPAGRSTSSGTAPAMVGRWAVPSVALSCGRAANQPARIRWARLGEHRFQNHAGFDHGCRHIHHQQLLPRSGQSRPRSWLIRTSAMDCQPPVLQQVPCAAERSHPGLVVGSSATSRSGPQASAMAIMMRWRWPPENWCGYSSSRCASLLAMPPLQQLGGAGAPGLASFPDEGAAALPPGGRCCARVEELMGS